MGKTAGITILNKKKILLVKGTEGLGNRILSLLTAILYAQLSERTLVIDWRDLYYSKEKTNAFNYFFTYNNENATVRLPLTDSIAPPIWRYHLHDSVDDVLLRYAPDSACNPSIWSRFSADLSRLDHEEDILVMWSFFEQIDVLRRHFHGKFAELRRMNTKSILRKLMGDHLRIRPVIQKQIDRFENEYFEHPTVGLHIRYSDKRSRLSPMLKKLDILIKKHPELQIFLATDNSEMRQTIENKYRRVLTIPKWYPAPGIPMHISSSDRSDPRQHGIEALVDICLLAACDYLILDESSAFAYVASLISHTPEERIFNFQRGKWMPRALRHKIWILKVRLEENLSKGKRGHQAC